MSLALSCQGNLGHVWHCRACHGRAWQGTSHHTTSRNVTSYHVTSQHGTAWHGMARQCTARHVKSCHGTCIIAQCDGNRQSQPTDMPSQQSDMKILHRRPWSDNCSESLLMAQCSDKKAMRRNTTLNDKTPGNATVHPHKPIAHHSECPLPHSWRCRVFASSYMLL